jgi:hypothetical protein
MFLASLAAFAVPFVWPMVCYACPDTGLTFRELRARLVLLAILSALALYVEIFYGFGIPWRFMYPVVAAAGRSRRGVVIGGGTPFLPPVTEDVSLDLIETRTFGSRVIYERYQRVREDAD